MILETDARTKKRIEQQIQEPLELLQRDSDVISEKKRRNTDKKQKTKQGNTTSLPNLAVELETEKAMESPDTSSGYISNTTEKPYLRGKIHRFALYSSVLLYFPLLLLMKNANKGALTLYFLSQLFLYWTSSTYHMTDWDKRQKERIFRKLDHISIFFLISGTQTCVLVALKKESERGDMNVMLPASLSYMLSFLGVFKVLFFFSCPRAVNVLYYIAHGCVPAFFIPWEWVSKLTTSFILCFLGGAFYIIGGMIYGFRKPDPFPSIFGYHEIFHTLTVLANLCFLGVIVRVMM